MATATVREALRAFQPIAEARARARWVVGQLIGARTRLEQTVAVGAAAGPPHDAP